jgi:cytochrome P450
MTEIDLSDVEGFWAKPLDYRHAAFDELRAQPGLPFFAEPEFGSLPRGRGYYALTRLDDILIATRNPGTFISGKGNATAVDMPPEFLDQSMISMDDPRHARLRRIVSRGFTNKMIASLAESVTQVADKIIDDVIDQGEADAVEDIAAKLPLRVICDMMGIPEKHHKFVFDQTNKMMGVSDPDVADTEDAFEALFKAVNELTNFLHELAAERAENPGDDLISKLLSAEINGEALTPAELAQFFILLTGAGTETTRNAITWGIHQLTEHPEQRAIWLADIDGVTPTAVEEIVRWSTPVLVQRRTVADDAEPVELGGQLLGPGDKLMMFYWAANRDPRHFTDPAGFDVKRSPNPHIGYGGPGPHFCLGAHLARLELSVMFRRLLTRIPDIHATAEPARLKSPMINGIKKLPVAFTRGGAR